MAQKIQLKNHFSELKIFYHRIAVAIVFSVTLIGILIGRLVYLQIEQHEHFSTLSQNNRVSVQAIPPTRGLIYDRNGIILAENQPTHILQIIPEQTQDIDHTLAELGKMITITENDLERFKKEVLRKRRFEGIPLRFRLTDDEVAQIAINLYRLPGVEIRSQLTRYYPFPEATAHIIGYVGRINEAELKTLDTTNYSGTNHIGKIGVEHFYENLLHGKVGHQKVETNVRGRVLRILESSDPEPGHDLYLNIDIRLQKLAMDSFNGENGALVAIDPQTGQVLAMASTPSYDANLFVNGIDHKSYNELNTSIERPLLNRSIKGAYPPGSTVKPFLALGGLELNVISQSHDIYCPGFYRLKGKEHKYRCWKKWGHGATEINKSIVQSCDVFFYDLAFQMGIDRIHDYMSLFGFGHTSGIDLSNERVGVIPSREWKRETKGQAWYPGETLIAGIGQGYMLVTPLQLALGTATLANGGTRYQPQVVNLVKQRGEANPVQIEKKADLTIPIRNQDNWDMVFKAMTDVIHSARGTARVLNQPEMGYQIAGKTGTAQVFSVAQDAEYKEDEIKKKLRDHALFMAFAPIDNPQIAVAVIVENGGHGGSVAAPIAGKIIDAWLNRDKEDERNILRTFKPSTTMHIDQPITLEQTHNG